MEADRQEAATFNKGHGRFERREFTSTTILNTHLNWPGVRQVCRIVRTRVCKGETACEVQYAITSVDRGRADAATLMKWWRGHWRIENQVHWVRDETFGEDRCRVRTGSAPQVLAGVRNLVMNWLRSERTDNIAAALRENGWNPQRLFTRLGKRNQ